MATQYHADHRADLLLSSTSRIVSVPRRVVSRGVVGAGSTSASVSGKYSLRSFARFAVNPDVSAALLDDTEHRREPQPSALVRIFGGDERLENARVSDGDHAHSGIAHRQPVSLTANIPKCAQRGGARPLGQLKRARRALGDADRVATGFQFRCPGNWAPWLQSSPG